MTYNFIIDDFEGPLDLLLHLIDKSKIDIYDIPINSITDQYILYLDRMEELNLDVTSEFLVMASTLLQIKSKRLLPKKEDLDEDEEDPEIELITRLIEYKKYKEAAKEIKSMSEDHQHRFYKKQEDLSYLIEDEMALEDVSLDQLKMALDRVLVKSKKLVSDTKIEFKSLEREEFPVEESIEKLKNLLDDEARFSFEEAFDLDSSRSEIISMFLAILELAKISYIKIDQEDNYGQIYIRKVGDLNGK